MCKQISLKNRKNKRDIVMSLIGVLSRDNKNRPIKLVVPGSNGVQYYVILRRKESTIFAECNKGDYEACKGNSRHNTLCYHSLAAIEYSIREAAFKGYWCETFEDAQKLQNLFSGKIYQAKSWQGKGEAWVLVTKVSE